jgi:hypothetical protein
VGRDPYSKIIINTDQKWGEIPTAGAQLKTQKNKAEQDWEEHIQKLTIKNYTAKTYQIILVQNLNCVPL